MRAKCEAMVPPNDEVLQLGLLIVVVVIAKKNHSIFDSVHVTTNKSTLYSHFCLFKFSYLNKTH